MRTVWIVESKTRRDKRWQLIAAFRTKAVAVAVTEMHREWLPVRIRKWRPA